MVEDVQAPAAGGDRGPLLTTEQAARLIMKDPSRIRQLRKGGYIPRASDKGNDNRYHLLDVVHGYIRFRDEADRRKAAGSMTSRVADARAREIELRNAIRESKLIDRDEAIETTNQMVALIRTVMSEVPARCSRDPVMQNTLKAILDDIVAGMEDEAMKLSVMWSEPATTTSRPSKPSSFESRE